VGNNFERLAVWKRSVDLAVRLYGHLQDCRDYLMKDQMTRSASHKGTETQSF
jgi:hypothetical protein